MIVYDGQVLIENPIKLFFKYEVVPEDFELYLKMIEKDQEDEAISLFIDTYIVEPVFKYNAKIGYYLLITEQGEIKKEDKSKMIRNISLLSFALLTLLTNNFSILIKKLVSPMVYTRNGITSKKVKDAILDATLGQFTDLTSKTMTGTQTDVLKNIRNMQKEMIIFNQTRAGTIKKTEIDKEVSFFLEGIKKKFPEYQKMKEGRILASKIISSGNQIRYYKLEDYVEMSARTTLLNVDRVASQIQILNKEAERAKKKGRKAINVAKYTLIDSRPLKTGVEREICKHILQDKRYGQPLLALDQKTADILGIMTVDEAMSSGDQAMGPYCRHGLRPISVVVHKRLEKILKGAL